jgi:hypothetical protein
MAPVSFQGVNAGMTEAYKKIGGSFIRVHFASNISNNKSANPQLLAFIANLKYRTATYPAKLRLLSFTRVNRDR